MLTIADGGGRGGPGTPDFSCRNMWTVPIDIFQKKLKNIDIDIFEIFFVMKIAIYISYQ